MIASIGRRFLTVCLVAAGLAFAAVLVQTSDSAAQVRGLPTFFEPSFGYSTRLGVDVGWWGETSGTTLSVNASHQFFVGNCERIALGLYLNGYDVTGGSNFLHGGAVSTAVMVLPCPMANSIVNPSLWIIGGAGAVSFAGSRRANAIIGLGAGYMLDEFAVVKIEPRVTVAMHYRDLPAFLDESSWKPDLSLGLNLGVGASYGIRTAVGCCIEGVSYTVGLSLWQ